MQWNQNIVDIADPAKYPNAPNIGPYQAIQNLLVDQQQCSEILLELNSLVLEQISLGLGENAAIVGKSSIPVEKQLTIGDKIAKQMNGKSITDVDFSANLNMGGYSNKRKVYNSDKAVNPKLSLARLVYLSVLDRTEKFNNFKAAETLGNLAADDEFFSQLRKKALFVDTGAGFEHGWDAHRIQWFIIMFKYHSDKTYFQNTTPIALYSSLADDLRCKNMVDKKVGGGTKYLWDDVVDCETAAIGAPASANSPWNFTAPECITQTITRLARIYPLSDVYM
ncbi:LirA/MavJ family T4SS effector [Agaribacter marinus]|uniref:DUF5636 domain-containing protein n=1 Tax=Agaribacter marinus TaxID=1431249 RepID=A0AA37SZ41_9ALTE|nr:LirA/MavJ family T4SS effector [Agaribacter marinus]GLR70571.1 hypothetical protein GCM10007852_14790 [Agaribacter marinus]